MSEDGVRRNSEQMVGGRTRSVSASFSGDGVDEACATGERGWELGTKRPQEAARARPRRERRSTDVSWCECECWCVCWREGVRISKPAEEIVGCLGTGTLCVCCGVSLGKNPNICRQGTDGCPESRVNRVFKLLSEEYGRLVVIGHEGGSSRSINEGD